jgi:hypothetical protein
LRKQSSKQITVSIFLLTLENIDLFTPIVISGNPSGNDILEWAVSYFFSKCSNVDFKKSFLLSIEKNCRAPNVSIRLSCFLCLSAAFSVDPSLIKTVDSLQFEVLCGIFDPVLQIRYLVFKLILQICPEDHKLLDVITRYQFLNTDEVSYQTISSYNDFNGCGSLSEIAKQYSQNFPKMRSDISSFLGSLEHIPFDQRLSYLNILSVWIENQATVSFI